MLELAVAAVLLLSWAVWRWRAGMLELAVAAAPLYVNPHQAATCLLRSCSYAALLAQGDMKLRGAGMSAPASGGKVFSGAKEQQHRVRMGTR